MFIGHTDIKGKTSSKKSVISFKLQITGRPYPESYFDFVSKRALMEYQASAKILKRNQDVTQGELQGQQSVIKQLP